MKKIYRTRTIKIKARVPCDIPEDQIAGFIADALETWGGQRYPDDPLFQSLSVYHVSIGGVLCENPEPKKLDETPYTERADFIRGTRPS